MNDMIVTGGAEAVMSSREIAELVEKRHDNVKRTIETLVERGVISVPQFEEAPTPGGGKPVKTYLVGKRDSFVVVAQLSPEFTARLVDRWQELEQAIAAAPVIDPMVALNDPAMLRTALLGYTEKVIALEGQVSEMREDVDALDRIAKADGSMCVTDAAKTLQIRPKDLFAYLRQNGWLYRRVGAGHDCAYQSKLVAGLMMHKSNTVQRQDGTDKEVTQARVTPKGLAKLAKLLPPAVMDAA